jgi:hypothetical protein
MGRQSDMRTEINASEKCLKEGFLTPNLLNLLKNDDKRVIKGVREGDMGRDKSIMEGLGG